MAGCRSWRPVLADGHDGRHRPGSCRVCWRPCFRRATPGQVRCRECAYALAEHPDPLVRVSLVAEGAEPQVLWLLASDLDPMVRLAAGRRRDTAGRDGDEERSETTLR